MTREEAIDVLSDFRKFTLSILGKSIYADRCSALDMAIEALSADTVSREEYEEVKAYMDTLVDAFIEDGEELAESVKVVRCKDCKYNLGETRSGRSILCNYCSHGVLIERDKNWYCADGEREEE